MKIATSQPLPIPPCSPNVTRDRIIGIIAGIISGVAYGLNPLFGMPLMTDVAAGGAGMSVISVLFYRYSIAAICLAIWMLIRHERFRLTKKQMGPMLAVAVMFAMSSITLFESYKYMPSGIATTIIFVAPSIVAVIMVIFKVFPSWQTWGAILMSFIGVLLLSYPEGEVTFQWQGIVIAMLSALSYAFFMVIINRSRSLDSLSSVTMTFYVLVIGTIMFLAYGGAEVFNSVPQVEFLPYMLGLSIVPTIFSTTLLALSTQKIGPTQAAVLGVLEPVTAMGIGVLKFNEPFTFLIALGLLLSILAIVIMTLEKRSSN